MSPQIPPQESANETCKLSNEPKCGGTSAVVERCIEEAANSALKGLGSQWNVDDMYKDDLLQNEEEGCSANPSTMQHAPRPSDTRGSPKLSDDVVKDDETDRCQIGWVAETQMVEPDMGTQCTGQAFYEHQARGNSLIHTATVSS